MKLAILLLFSLIPTSLAFAQEERQIAMSAQIIVRDSDHRLVAYLQVNKIEYVSLGALHTLLDSEYNPQLDQIVSVNGQNLQIIRRSIDYIADSDNVASDITLNKNLGDKIITIVRPIHDGIPVKAGDTITFIWTFIRTV